ncbi:MAG: MazG nucleotide pyrophosphohydrolase domain-containing protein [Acidimicrobiales bacterium]
MPAAVTVCGLGPGGHDRLTAETRNVLAGTPHRFVRTLRHPTADLDELAGAVSFDDVYERADTFDDVYREIAETVAAAAIGSDEPVVYAVPGSPLILERSVQRLLADDRLDVTLLPAISFLDDVWARLALDPVEESVRLVDGHRFERHAAGERGPLLVAHVHAQWVLSDIKLAIDAGDEQRAVVLQRLGTPEERIFEVAWPDLDREVEADHLTSLYLPEVAEPVGQELVRSVELMRRLRQDCPWDRDQTHASLRSYLIEETFEVVDALDALTAGEPAYADLEEELGDLWFQILFHAELAAEEGQFTIADVARSLHDKMVERHPHVFGDPDQQTGEQSETPHSETPHSETPRSETLQSETLQSETLQSETLQSETLQASWDRIKGLEKDRSSALDGIAPALPALALAAKTLSRASRAGVGADFGVDGAAVTDRGTTGIDEATLGRRLFELVALADSNDLDPEAALRLAVRAAASRFRREELEDGGPAASWVLG